MSPYPWIVEIPALDLPEPADLPAADRRRLGLDEPPARFSSARPLPERRFSPAATAAEFRLTDI